MSCKRSPLGPLRLPADAFIEIEPRILPDGSTRRRFRIKGLPEDFICEEVRSELIAVGPITPEPMKMPPTAGVFFLEYSYGTKGPNDPADK